jgi:DNA-binding transcriptional MerR regulator
MAKAAEAFRTISEVADDLGIQKHVLRFWEVKFSQIRPMKRGGGRRYYRPEDMELLRGIRQLLHRDGYTIKGVQKILREQGIEAVKERAREETDAREAAGGAPIAAAPVASPESPPEIAPAAAKARGGAPAKRLAGESRAVIATIIAELVRCREMLAGPAEAKGEGARRPERRPRRTA